MLTYKQFLASIPLDATSSPANAFWYAHDALNGPFPEGEKIIAQDANFAYRYAHEILHRRFHLGEPEILKSNPHIALDYARHVIKNRWPEAEDLLKTNQVKWESYQLFLDANFHTREDWEKNAWRWLKDPKFNIENTVEILNMADYGSSWGTTKAMQEYVCQHRPDLINQIYDLDPELAEKYSHEKEFGKVDL